MQKQEAIQTLIDTGRQMMEKGLTWGTAGNLSLRLDDTHMLITASGTDMGALDEESFTLCNLATGQTQGRRASKEMPMHAAVYQQAPWAQAVAHASPHYATLASASDLAVRNDLFVENMYYLQKVRRVPYCHPGSERLSRAVGEAAPFANVLLLCNHGVVTFDQNMSEALAALEMLENTCRMQVTMMAAGIKASPVSEEMRQDFLLRANYRPVRQCFKEEDQINS
ncbi:MAG: class II aldolase/adducin family protein [Comamonas sp.]|uniref:class II aldolase/adducin family protein n=1 Tax=Comamonas sp. TaxID=34028 RepID=UPI002FCB3AF0